ncbi:uncharacterized protein LOC132543158 [Ylistrum balloti]|uniref:uncharacterized protein LOC132543158 n=1 Tax=Ylistrum balloti TaxID=509963 RepID=UPI002905B49F|nr:uncharacterized protein LOC132543158 [Ylistrum balloti]
MSTLNGHPVFHADDRTHDGSESVVPTSSAIARGKALKNAMSFVRSPPSKPGPGSPMEVGEYKVECICNRDIKTILCRSCGMTFKGRVRRTCLMHPNNIHLMDLECCPNCKASHIKEFAESMASKRNI